MMKNIYLYTILTFVMLLTLFGCNDSEGDLLETKLYFEEELIKVSTEDDTYECNIAARLSKIAGSDMSVTYVVGGQDLVDQYNQKYSTSAALLPADKYSFDGNTANIKAGQVYAEKSNLNLKNLASVEEGSVFVLPIIISGGDVAMMPGHQVTYVIFKKPAVINKVTKFNPTWFNVQLPTSCKAVGSVTYEALVYATSWRNLGTIMGNEGVLILRTGDARHPDNELQVAGNITLQMPDVTVWEANKWYHVAFTYDGNTGIAALYLDGNLLVSKGVGAGKTFDLNNHFSIGYAYDYDRRRKWNGYMSEVRLWNVARTESQIRDNMMLVDPQSEGLLGYWKMNGEDIEERDGVWYVKDQTPNKNDATSNVGYRGDDGKKPEYAKPTIEENKVTLGQ